MRESLKEVLRTWFRARELGEDPRHMRGRGPWGAHRLFEGKQEKPSAPPMEPKTPAGDALVAPIFPPPEALEGRCADHMWVLTPFVQHGWQEARRTGREGVILTFELADCQYSVRLEQTLKAGQTHWTSRFVLVRFCLGSRMEKRWLRQLALGDGRLRLASLPMVMVMQTQAEGLSLKSIALSPLGAGQDQAALQALLHGTPQLAPGTQVERVRLWSGGTEQELSSQNGFFVAWKVTLAP